MGFSDRLVNYRVRLLGGRHVSLPYFVSRFAICLFTAHLYNDYVGTITQTAGPSMLPTVNVRGDWIYTSKLYRRGKGVRMGDVVCAKHPSFPDIRVLKRVLGMPGDFVLRDTPGEGNSGMMIQVPEGHCWLAGDNVKNSRDSRDYGPIPLALITGKVIVKVLPLRRFGRFKNGLEPVQS